MTSLEEIIPLSTIVKTAHCLKLSYLTHHKPNQEKTIIQNSLSAEKKVLKKSFLSSSEGNRFANCTSDSPPISLEEFEYKNGVYKDLHFVYKTVSFSVDFLYISDDRLIIYHLYPTTKVTFYTLLESLVSLLFLSEFTSKTVLYKYVYLHNQFTKGQPLSKLFIFRTFTKNHLISKEPLLTPIIESIQTMKQDSEPMIKMGMHCVKPYECVFKGTCWPTLPTDSIFYVHNMSKADKLTYMDTGNMSMSCLDKTKLTRHQEIQRDCHTNNSTFINKKELTKFISHLTYPLHFLDFEAVHFSYPLFDGIKPFQALPFQYSLHKQLSANHVPTHHSFLGEPGKDPRYMFLKTVLDALDSTGSIIAFDTHFEKETLVSLAKLFPEFQAKVNQILSRFIDLATPFQTFTVYSYKMKGKYSLKDILPAFIPELSYTPLSISGGEVASRAYVMISYAEKELVQKKMINQLKEYCFLDTYGLYRLTEVLQEFTLNK